MMTLWTISVLVIVSVIRKSTGAENSKSSLPFPRDAPDKVFTSATLPPTTRRSTVPPTTHPSTDTVTLPPTTRRSTVPPTTHPSTDTVTLPPTTRRSTVPPTTHPSTVTVTLPPATRQSTITAAVTPASTSTIDGDRLEQFTQEHPGGGGFDLLVKRGVYVDKTQFILDFLHQDTLSQVLLITYPRRFGKSVIVDMCEKFFAYTFDSFGKFIKSAYAYLFDNTIIGKEEEVIKHFQGKYPVISVTFRSINGASYERMQKSFIKSVLRAPENGLCKKFSFLRFVLKNYTKDENSPNHADFKDDLKTFSMLCHAPAEEVDVEDLKFSIVFFANLLQRHTGKKVFIFIDEYDQPLNRAFAKASIDDQDDIIDFFKVLFQETLKQVGPLKQGIVTGTVRIAKQNLFTGMNNVAEYNILRNKFFKYYGFNKDEVRDLINKRGGISQELRNEAEYYYDGYRTADDLDLAIYNPWAVSRFIEDRYIGSFWEQSGSIHSMVHVFLDSRVRKLIQRIIDGQPVEVEINNLSFQPDILRLLYHKENRHMALQNTHINHILSLLYTAGYLTIDDGVKNRAKSMIEIQERAFLVFPNKLTKRELCKLLLNNHPKTEEKLFENMEIFSDKLNDMFTNENLEESTKAFKASFKKLLKDLPSFTLQKPATVKPGGRKPQIYFSEEFIHSLINVLALRIQADYFAMELCIQHRSNRTDFTAWNTKTDEVMILDVKIYRPETKEKPRNLQTLCKKALEGFNQAKKYAKIFASTEIKNILFVGVSVSVDKSVSVVADLEPCKKYT